MRNSLSFLLFKCVLWLCCLQQLASTIEAKSMMLTTAEITTEMTSKSSLNLATASSVLIDPTAQYNMSSVLTETEVELFVKSLSSIRNKKCRDDLNATLNGILTGKQWAISMYDATAKTSFGIENGILHQFGHFDECLDAYGPMSTDTNEIPVRAKYCLANVEMNGLTVRNIDTREKKSVNYTVAYWGACVPASCSGSDLETYLSIVLQRSVNVDEAKCQLRAAKLIVSDEMLAYAVVIAIFILLAMLSTAYHVYLICMSKQNDGGLPKTTLQNETLNIALLSFSIIENTKKLFQASKEQLGLNSINGIKALAMLFILFGHALSFIYSSPGYNKKFINEHIKNPAFGFLPNSLLFVDVFLVLSGFLFCRILLVELERRRGKINVMVLYAGRYIRLTPAYMAIVGFYMTWFIHVGNGPIWQERIMREQQRCRESWWLNMLYINNYVNTDKLCMFQSWYLCVDSQMFFISPIFIYLLYKFRKAGLHFLNVAVIVTAIIPFIVTYVQKWDPTLLAYADEINDLGSNVFYIGSYIKTHMRASGYILGLLVGYLVHLMQEKGTTLPRNFVRLAWLLSIFAGVASMFSVSRFYIAPYTNIEATMYAGFHRLGWNLSIAWLVLAVTTGHSGWLQRLLSSRIFAPLSRLTYCAYLSNGIVELYHSSIVRTPTYMSYINLTNSAFGHILNTFTLAFVLCLLFESPIHALERILLRKYGGRERKGPASAAEKSNSQTPSTSEEQMS